jgi:hypothetical protein
MAQGGIPVKANWTCYPLVAGHPYAQRWIQCCGTLGLAKNMLAAYSENP